MELHRPFATVTPTLDGDVLAVLATHDSAFTTGQIHRILDRFSEEGVRKVLARLVAQGVVTANRVANAFSYQLNRDHLAAEPIMALAGLSNTFLSKLEGELDQWDHPPKFAAVFGSALHGTMTVHSDIDLFLVQDRGSPDAAWTHHVDELAARITGWTGNDARIISYTIGELRRAAAEPMVGEICVSGLTLAGSRAWFLNQVRPMAKKRD
ncbi:nucleotidyltransferase domain-containing protein [[Mycobacterium] vasticus]|uniref:Nucleotidyltransferase domain-containing protein n=1 Tax=[Mycobacterium] vasticus TaxID=2875777 RepID=A0ABU5YYR5_9MYCO|nr:nucleotidyltransferase domain-containing protein [Mycolicibacter sp. MYC017]MEB3068848.1 nucleotidyltransferase domain-containing protein [Mycolicibacter sp. MYC017]